MLTRSRLNFLYGAVAALVFFTLLALTAPAVLLTVLLAMDGGVLVALVGAVLLLLFVTGAGAAQPLSQARSRLLDATIRLAWASLALGGVLLAWQAAASLPGLPLTAWGDALLKALFSLWGGAWLLRQVLLVGLLELASHLRSGLTGSPQRGLSLLLGYIVAGLALAQILPGHAEALMGGAAVWGMLVGWVHFLAVGGWAGGWMVLAALLRGKDETASAVVRRFERLALLSALAAAGSGLINTGQQVPSLEKLLAMPYGQLLLVKAGVALLAGLAGLLLWRSGAVDQPTRLARALLFQAAAAGTVLLLAGALQSSAAANLPAFTAGSTALAPVLAPAGLLLLALALVLAFSWREG